MKFLCVCVCVECIKAFCFAHFNLLSVFHVHIKINLKNCMIFSYLSVLIFPLDPPYDSKQEPRWVVMIDNFLYTFWWASQEILEHFTLSRSCIWYPKRTGESWQIKDTDLYCSQLSLICICTAWSKKIGNFPHWLEKTCTIYFSYGDWFCFLFFFFRVGGRI
jgi:hypothetical protein